MKLEATSSSGLDEVGDDGFEGGETCSEEGEDETPGGEVVVSIGTVGRQRGRRERGVSSKSREGNDDENENSRKSNSSDHWKQRKDLHPTELGSKEDDGYQDGEERGGGSDDLMELRRKRDDAVQFRFVSNERARWLRLRLSMGVGEENRGRWTYRNGDEL